MPEKLTLAVYLERRGSVKALTRIEAEVFGVPYPLVKGWAHRHGTTEITPALLDQLQERISYAKLATAEKARRGLQGVTSIEGAFAREKPGRESIARPQLDLRIDRPLFPGFLVRLVRRKRR